MGEDRRMTKLIVVLLVAAFALVFATWGVQAGLSADSVSGAKTCTVDQAFTVSSKVLRCERFTNVGWTQKSGDFVWIPSVTISTQVRRLRRSIGIRLTPRIKP